MSLVEKKIFEFLGRKKVKYEIFEHKPVYTCKEMAKTLNTERKNIAKCMMLKKEEGGFILLVLPGNKSVDLKKISSFLGYGVELAKPEEVLRIAGCEIGCVYPFGNLMNLETFFDEDILENEFVFFNPGNHKKSVKISTKNLLELVKPEVIRLKEKTTKIKKEGLGITAKKSENFSEWYTQVVQKAELADYAPVQGCMVIKPNGYAIWERIKEILDKEFRRKGVRNAYFPQFIPESFLKKETEHFEGFVPECAWVTIGGGKKLGEKLAIRPTSETIIYSMFSKWIRSWRDLPFKINQWCNIVRWESSTKFFIRTTEFLWQEGHTAHATEEESERMMLEILEVYRHFIEGYLAIPVLVGRKSEKEKFAGALTTTTLEALMPDGKAVQMGTSHNLGQNFSKVFDVKFLDKDGKEKFVWNTSWGVSTRLIGSLIMTHGDDKGLILPPKIAHTHIVIVPIFYEESEKKEVLKEAKNIKMKLEEGGIKVILDDREEYTPGWKFHEWELKGIPLRIEIGPKDIKKNQVVVARRDNFEKFTVKEKNLVQRVKRIMDEIQKALFEKAEKRMREYTTTVKNYEEFKKILKEKGGFIRACWCGKRGCEERIKEETGASLRVIPLKKEKVFAECVYCGKKAKEVVYFAKAY